VPGHTHICNAMHGHCAVRQTGYVSCCSHSTCNSYPLHSVTTSHKLSTSILQCSRRSGSLRLKRSRGSSVSTAPRRSMNKNRSLHDIKGFEQRLEGLRACSLLGLADLAGLPVCALRHACKRCRHLHRKRQTRAQTPEHCACSPICLGGCCLESDSPSQNPDCIEALLPRKSTAALSVPADAPLVGWSWPNILLKQEHAVAEKHTQAPNGLHTVTSRLAGREEPILRCDALLCMQAACWHGSLP
jgi:hypothetical protein